MYYYFTSSLVLARTGSCSTWLLPANMSLWVFAMDDLLMLHSVNTLVGKYDLRPFHR